MVIDDLLIILFLKMNLVFLCFISATSGSLNVMGNHQFDVDRWSMARRWIVLR